MDRNNTNDTKAHHDENIVVGEQSNPPSYNQVLSQKSSTLSLINKNSTSLDEPSYNSVNNSSTKPRHSVPNVLDSEGNSNTSTILPLSSNSNCNFPNNISHVTVTTDVLKLSGSALSSNEKSIKQLLDKDTNLNEASGATKSGIVQTNTRNIDKDDLQLKWEATVGSKFKVVVS